MTVPRRLLAVARGDAPADLLLAGGMVADVFTGEIRRADVAVVDGLIACVGPPREAVTVQDVSGGCLAPGLIDAHVHLESSLVTPAEFARAVVPRGTTAVVCDPHEIANVAGLDGIRWLLAATEGLPLTVLVNAPSCVPASPLATSGAELSAADLVQLLDQPRVLGLGEVMNVPGAVLGDPGVWEKLAAFRGRPVDGHAPAVSGGWLQAYAAAGILTDHECTTEFEAREKLQLGLHVLLREGSAARNLVDLLPVVGPETAARCALCTDDRHPHDLQERGHVDHLLRLAVGHGLAPLTALRLATLSPATIYGLRERGAVAPGRVADLVLVRDLGSFRAERVWVRGQLVAENGEPSGSWPESEAPAPPGQVRVNPGEVDLTVPDRGLPVRVITVEPGQIVTGCEVMRLPASHGVLHADPGSGVAKLAVVERHRGTGNVGLGFVRGLGLGSGAIGGTVAHDHHNLVVAGMDDRSMHTAIRALSESGGGLVATQGGEVLALLELPVAGLMSPRPLSEVRTELDRLQAAARSLGSALPDPFMTLSFLALEVIPDLKLTDLGLVDVSTFAHVPLHVEADPA